jgi:mono/diheme cytochrome c family protein
MPRALRSGACGGLGRVQRSVVIACGLAGAALVAGGLAVMQHGTRVEARAVLDRYCVGCHDSAERAGGLALDRLSLEQAGEHAEVWESVVRKLRTGFMPPAGEPRPERATLDSLAGEIERTLDAAGAGAPGVAFKGISRLNRAEYRNAIRDLLAYDATALVATLPPDDAIQGFDNIAEALTVSPTLIEGYVAAALKISRGAVGDRSQAPAAVTYEAPGGSQTAHVDGLPLGTRGGFKFTHQFPLDATYEFRVRSRGRGALAGQRFCPAPRVDVTLDGRPLALEDPGTFRLDVAAGPRELTVGLIDEHRCEGVNELFGVYSPGGGIDSLEIHGPFDPTGLGDTPSRRAIFSCKPPRSDGELACAREILSRLASRAYRRPVGSGDSSLETLLRFYEQGREGADFEAGIANALARLLVDPRFLYRFEEEPPNVAPGETYRVSDLELASRLSFFLWSSIPDEELLAAAVRGELRDPASMEHHVRRMLADARASALTANFAGQWLKLRELEGALPQDPGFDAQLRAAFRRETELLFEHVVREDLSVLELLSARYTYLDERLARHYGIAGVTGSYFRRVELRADSPRGGLLGQGSVLTATSVANRTSPVVRGAFVVESLLGAEVPPPPPGVEVDLSGARSPAEAKTLRQRMEAHRANPVCASCHGIVDPFGFALENFDLIGRWRTTDGGEPIDAATQLVDGTPIEGPSSLRRALLDRSDAFATAFVEKLATYAFGRIVEARDKPALRRVVAQAAAADYRLAEIVIGIANSVPFATQTKPTAVMEER